MRLKEDTKGEMSWLISYLELTLHISLRTEKEGSRKYNKSSPALSTRRQYCYAREFWRHNPIIQWFHSNACSTSFPTELICSTKQFLPVTSHLCHQFPCFFFPLEIGPVTNHLTSDLLSSFLELHPTPFFCYILQLPSPKG
jgi:hypothetical protein